jgi:osmotically-inducible protein OsmY
MELETTVNFGKLGLAGLMVGAALLAGCDKPAGSSAEATKSPPVSAQIESAANKVGKAAENAGDKAKETMSAVGDKVEAATDKAKVVAADTAITAAVKSKFIADPDLKAIDISVDTVNGQVTLLGSVDTERNRDKAAAVAKQVDGVTSVDNRLALRK